MFDEIGDMPLHPLVTHAPVIGIPLAMLLALLFAVPAHPELGALAAGADRARLDGRRLRLPGERRGAAALTEHPAGGNPVGDLIAEHSRLADQLFYIMLGYSVLTLVTVFLVGRRPSVRRAATPTRMPSRAPALSAIVLLLLLLADRGRRDALDRTGRRHRRPGGVEPHRYRAARPARCSTDATRDTLAIWSSVTFVTLITLR